MLEALNVTPASIDRVLIGGSFGYHLQAESILSLGLLPRGIVAPFTFIGNSSKEGAVACLIREGQSKPLIHMASQISSVELSDHPSFQTLFISHMSLG